MKNSTIHWMLALSTAILMQAAVASPARAEAPQVGIGFNMAGGVASADVETDGLSIQGLGPLPLVEIASFELRLAPTDRFSIDSQWNITSMAVSSAVGLPRYEQNFYFHLHAPVTRNVDFAVAPMVGFALTGQPGAGYGGLNLGTRVGMEFSTESDVFEFGVYLRPGVNMIRAYGGDVAVGHAALEMTWIWHLPRG